MPFFISPTDCDLDGNRFVELPRKFLFLALVLKNPLDTFEVGQLELMHEPKINFNCHEIQTFK
jgi:hypothetical protein